MTVTSLLLVSSLTSLLGIILLLSVNSKFIGTKRFVLIFSIIITFGFSYNFYESENYYINRLQRIIAFEDNSFLQRVVGSWNISIETLDNKFLGSGLGQEPLITDTLSNIEYVSNFNIKINNAFAFVFYENGYLGLVILLISLILLSFKSIVATSYLTYFLMCQGCYFFSPGWIFFILIISTKNYFTRNDEILKSKFSFS